MAEPGSNPGSPDPGSVSPHATQPHTGLKSQTLLNCLIVCSRSGSFPSRPGGNHPCLNPPSSFPLQGLRLFLLPGALLQRDPLAGSQPTTLPEWAISQPHAFWDIAWLYLLHNSFKITSCIMRSLLCHPDSFFIEYKLHDRAKPVSSTAITPVATALPNWGFQDSTAVHSLSPGAFPTVKACSDPLAILHNLASASASGTSSPPPAPTYQWWRSCHVLRLHRSASDLRVLCT